VELRRARSEEYAAIGRLTVAAYDPFLLGPEDFYRARLADTATRDAEAEVWVAAEADGSPLGAVTICPPGSPWREIAHEGEGEFRMLAVAPAAQGRGVGRALTGLVIERARDDGESSIVLSSLDLMSTAHRLYESLGFVRAPERDWRPQPDVSLLVYALELR